MSKDVSANKVKKIAVTMGDPGGIGPEVILRAFQSQDMLDFCIPIVIGDRIVMEEAARLPGLFVKLNIIRTPEEAKATAGTIDMIDLATLNSFHKNRPTAEGGRASAAYIRKAVETGCQQTGGRNCDRPYLQRGLKDGRPALAGPYGDACRTHRHKRLCDDAHRRPFKGHSCHDTYGA